LHVLVKKFIPAVGWRLWRIDRTGAPIVSLAFEPCGDGIAFGDAAGAVAIVRDGAIGWTWDLSGELSDVLWSGNDVLGACDRRVVLLKEKVDAPQ
jgi:hypothetical protein